MKCINLISTGITLCVPPKCGGSSVMASLMSHYDVKALVDVPDITLIPPCSVSTPVMQVVRHPVARFASLWRNKCRDKGRLLGHQEALWGLTPAELLTYVKTHHNRHWEAQATVRRELATDDVTLVPLYALSAWWRDNTPYPALERLNLTAGSMYNIDKGLADSIAWHYRDDVELYEESTLVE